MRTTIAKYVIKYRCFKNVLFKKLSNFASNCIIYIYIYFSINRYWYRCNNYSRVGQSSRMKNRSNYTERKKKKKEHWRIVRKLLLPIVLLFLDLYSRSRLKGERRVRCFALLLLSHPVGGTTATKRQRTCPSSCVKTDAPLLPRLYRGTRTGRK